MKFLLLFKFINECMVFYHRLKINKSSQIIALKLSKNSSHLFHQFNTFLHHYTWSEWNPFKISANVYRCLFDQEIRVRCNLLRTEQTRIDLSRMNCTLSVGVICHYHEVEERSKYIV